MRLAKEIRPLINNKYLKLFYIPKGDRLFGVDVCDRCTIKTNGETIQEGKFLEICLYKLELNIRVGKA